MHEEKLQDIYSMHSRNRQYIPCCRTGINLPESASLEEETAMNVFEY
jgi:hypothetical protein